MKQILLYLFAIIFAGCVVNGQETHVPDDFKFECIEKPLIGDYKFYQLLLDYTLNLPEFFTDSTQLPRDSKSEFTFYYDWAINLPPCSWDFIELDTNGILTVKQGYRWDGATNGVVDAIHNHRSSMVHDVFYDLMRLELLARDYYDIGDPGTQDNAGDYNRKLADMLYYMLAMQDGDSEEGAEFDYFFIRNMGRIGTVMESRLSFWKYHVSNLNLTCENNEVKLSWKLPDIYETNPNENKKIGYNLYRNEILYLRVNENDTAFTDINIEEGKNYTYQLRPKNESDNQYDWSNKVSYIQDSASLNVISNYKETGINLHISPNPFVDKINISFSIPHEAYIRIEIYSLTGELKGILLNEWKEIGNYNVSCTPSNLPSGVYICKIDVGNTTVMHRQIAKQ